MCGESMCIAAIRNAACACAINMLGTGPFAGVCAIKATVDATAEKVTSIGEDADSMLTIVGEITEGVEGIAASAEQNAAAATQMSEASGKVNNIVEMFAASAEENSAAAEEVAASVDTAKEQSEAISAASKRVDSSLEELTAGLAKLAQLT